MRRDRADRDLGRDRTGCAATLAHGLPPADRLDRPGIAAERLPKALIHRNIPGEGVHAFLAALDREWTRAATVAPFGPVQRWQSALAALAAEWPLVDRSRRRQGEVTVAWDAVAPR